jgi:hypothetical protein
MSQSNQEDDLALVSRALGGLPIINHVLDRLGLPGLLAGVLPARDARQKLAPAAAIRVVVTNLVLGREPLYAPGRVGRPLRPGPAGADRSRRRRAQRRPRRAGPGGVVRRRPGQPADRGRAPRGQ